MKYGWEKDRKTLRNIAFSYLDQQMPTVWPPFGQSELISK
jgi:hypothetical protein